MQCKPDDSVNAALPAVGLGIAGRSGLVASSSTAPAKHTWQSRSPEAAFDPVLVADINGGKYRMVRSPRNTARENTPHG
jgi:hypothetical protein